MAAEGDGTVEDPYVITGTDSFLSLRDIINSGKPVDENTLPEGVTSDDYAIFGITENYQTAWNTLYKANYKIISDISVDSSFMGLNNFAGYLDFDGHKFTWNDCVYTVSGLQSAHYLIGIINGLVNGVSSASDSVVGVGNVHVTGSITVNVLPDAIFASNVYFDIGSAYSLVNLGAGSSFIRTGSIYSDADITVNIASNSPPTSGYVIGGITGSGSYLRTVENHNTLTSDGDITIHILTSSSPTLFVGGIYGYSGGSTRLLYCRYGGTISVDNDVPTSVNSQGFTNDNSNKYLGGIIGRTGGWAYSESMCFNGTLDVDLSAPASSATTQHIGGIIGYSYVSNTDEGPSILCMNLGNIDITDASDKRTTYLGGIIGSCEGNGKTTLSYLSDLGTIQYQSDGVVHAGGITGKDNSALNYDNCYWTYREVVTETALAGSSREDLSGLTRVNTICDYGNSVQLPVVDYIKNSLGESWYLHCVMKDWTTTKEDASVSASGVFAADAIGTYPVSCDIIFSYGKKDITIPCTIDITVIPSEVTVTMNDVEVEYDGSMHTIDASIDGKPDDLNLIYTYKVSTAADSTYTATKPVAPGTYTVNVESDTPNYVLTGTITATLTIKAPSDTDVSSMATVTEPASLIYDGNPKEYTATHESISTWDYIYTNEAGESLSGAPIATGNYVVTMVGEGEGSYAVVTKSFTIAPFSVKSDDLTETQILIPDVVSPENKTKLERLTGAGGKYADKFSGKTIFLIDVSLIDGGKLDHSKQVTFTIGYPSDSGITASNYMNYDFVVLHIENEGTETIIYPVPTSEGLQITSTLSPFAIGYSVKPHPSSSSSQGSSIWLTETPTPTPTATPTPSDAVPTDIPDVKPTQTPDSPSPILGILAGLGCAALVLRRR